MVVKGGSAGLADGRDVLGEAQLEQTVERGVHDRDVVAGTHRLGQHVFHAGRLEDGADGFQFCILFIRSFMSKSNSVLDDIGTMLILCDSKSSPSYRCQRDFLTDVIAQWSGLRSNSISSSLASGISEIGRGIEIT